MKKWQKVSIVSYILVLSLAFLVGCTVSRQAVVTNPDGSKSTNTVHSVDPRLNETIITGQAIAPLVPQPVGWIAGFGLAVAAAVGQSVASYKNKKESLANKKEAFKWEDVATTIIQGIESAGTQASAVKAAIKVRSTTDGNHDVVRDIVAAETKSVS